MNIINPKLVQKTLRAKRRERVFQIVMKITFVIMVVLATLIYIKYGR